jgi:hypothetical protein
MNPSTLRLVLVLAVIGLWASTSAAVSATADQTDVPWEIVTTDREDTPVCQCRAVRCDTGTRKSAKQANRILVSRVMPNPAMGTTQALLR